MTRQSLRLRTASATLEALLRGAGLALLVGATLLQADGARAATVPRLLPERDVEVQYTVTAPGRSPHDYDLSFSAESQRLRIDDSARGLWFLADLRTESAALVVPAMRVVVSETDLANLAALLKGAKSAQFTVLGKAMIAGLTCTRYRVKSADASGTTCLTRNGIALAVSGHDSHGSAQVIADKVTEAPVAPAKLLPPPDFARIQLPPGMIAALIGG